VKQRGELPQGDKFLSYIKRLSLLYVTIGALADLPWTAFVAWYLRLHHPAEVPQIPQICQILFAAAIFAIFYFFVGFLTYSSSHIIDPKFDPCRQVSSLREALKRNPNSVLYFIKVVVISFIFFLATFAPISYVLFVLTGREHFPYPNLLLNVTSICFIFPPLVFGKLLMRRGEKWVEEVAAVNP